MQSRDRDPHPLLAGEEQVRLRLGAQDVAALDHDHVGADAQRLERGVDLRAPAGGGDPERHTDLAQVREQLHGAGQRTTLGQELAEQLAVAALDLLDLLVAQGPAQLARHRPREEAAAHADAPMDAPALERQPRLGQRPLPGEDVGVDGVDQRAVEVEDQRSCHVANLRLSRLADD